jgi:hypothetical protein
LSAGELCGGENYETSTAGTPSIAAYRPRSPFASRRGGSRSLASRGRARHLAADAAGRVFDARPGPVLAPNREAMTPAVMTPGMIRMK